MTLTKDEDGWHLEKKVPISIIFALAINSCAGVWWASRVESRIERIEVLFLEQKVRDANQDATILDNRNERNQQLNRIDDKLERILSRYADRDLIERNKR